MTQTTNLGLKKIDGGDNWRQIFDDHNQSMDLVDEAVAKLQEELGIVCDGNMCAIAASAGQYVILKNSSISGLEDGLYTASKAIPANTAIDSTYLAAVSKGGLNALNSNLDLMMVRVNNTNELNTILSERIANMIHRPFLIWMNGSVISGVTSQGFGIACALTASIADLFFESNGIVYSARWSNNSITSLKQVALS